MFIDSGDASYGSLGNAFFESNKQYVIDNGIKDTVRATGIGGIKIVVYYKISKMPVSIGNHTLDIPEIVVTTDEKTGCGLYEANIGLRILMLYSFVNFNLVDFVLTTGDPPNPDNQ